ncbi:SEC5 [Candida jiufengensis]|uniref:SEC5 n=1 Tax=Candida jiufengensis TaxID=497108 RepID=UPI00222557E6|nr:SEC5 [Candida jiufengensis]KAI5950241.1 SEC5 [Candida jiufengensis]
MINFNPTQDQLLFTYNINSINPQQRSDIKSIDNNYNIDNLKKLTTEEKFKTLISIINSSSTAVENYENIDLEDPLKGSGSNVASTLKNLKLISSSTDPILSSFQISSQNFNVIKYLTTIQKDTPLSNLTNSLQYLERSINSHEKELQRAIDQNFETFVNCKYQIDDTLIEFDQQKSKVQKDKENSKYFNPQRHTITKKTSGINELTSELETSLNNLRTTNTLLIKPIEENKLKEEKYAKISNFIKSNEFFFNLPSQLIHSLSINNNRKFIDDYNKYMKEKKLFLHRIYQTNLEDNNMKLTIAIKLFQEIEEIAKQYRDKIYTELLSSDHEVNQKDDQKFMSLVENLMQLEENDQQSNKSKPIADFLNKQIDKLKMDFEHQVNKFDSKFLIMQNKLVDYVNSLNQELKEGSHINYISEKYEMYKKEIQSSKNNEEKMSIIEEAFQSNDNVDMSLINEAWLVLFNFITYLETLYMKLVDKFLNNYSYYYKMGVDPQGAIRDSFLKNVEFIASILKTLFDDDIKSADGNENQKDPKPSNYKQFVPCYSNSLSSINHLNKIQYKVNKLMTSLGDSIIRIGNMTNFEETNKHLKNLKNTSAQVNKKILEAVCSTWLNDCGQFYELEDWKIEEKYNTKDGSPTKLIHIIEYYQLYMLSTIGKLVKFKDNESKSGIVSPYPSKIILVSIEIQFMRTLDKIIDSIMKKFNMDRQLIKQELEIEVDQTKIEIFKILTMNNLDKLSKVIYPRLILKFDQVFDKDISTQKLKLLENIDKASSLIMSDILDNEKKVINNLIVNGFEKYQLKTYINQEIMVDQYIFEILMRFVKFVYKIKPLTSEGVFIAIISELQSHFAKGILDNLRIFQLSSSITQNQLILFNLKLDCNFVLQIFESSQKLKFNDSTFKTLQAIVKEIEIKKQELGKVDEKLFTNQIFEETLNDYLSTSSTQFNCF